MKQWAMVTGSTAGIGAATAKQLAKANWNLVLTGRRQQRLTELCEQLEQEYSVKAIPLCFDVSDRKACEQIFENNSEILKNLNLLVNNAGLARGVDPMDKADIDDWETMIDTNVKGLLYVTRLAVDYLKANQPAQIVNIGSVAGRWTYPGGGVYCSTKFAVRAISEGLRMDLSGHDIRVTNISPGLVETEFSQVRLEDEEKAKAVYQGIDALTADDIAECVAWTVNRPKHVNIQELVVFPTAQASVNLVHRQ